MGPRHSHGGGDGTAVVRRLVAAAAVAVLAAVALVAAWRTWQDGTAGPDGSSALSIPAQPSPSAAAPSPSAPSSPAPTVEPSATPDPTRSPRPRTSATRTVDDRPDRGVDVVVLNGTYRTGLAAQAADRLRRLGWDVVAVGNWRGAPVGRTTLFTTLEPAGSRRTLRADVPQIAAVRAPLPSMSHGRYVIVLADDYP